MASAPDLADMSLAEKLRLMERLWEDLSANDANIPSPDWHRDVLAERDRLVNSGEESYIDWEIAKKKLRAELE